MRLFPRDQCKVALADTGQKLEISIHKFPKSVHFNIKL